MRCPYCTSEDTRVVDSRPIEQGASIRRRRECEHCAERFTTYERTEVPLLIQKRDGRFQPFDQEKVRAGLDRALADHVVTSDEITVAVGRIENELRVAPGQVTTDDVGRLVLEFLRTVDEAAYLRFASVHKEFRDASDFEREAASFDRSD
jgi:transcriptional repressor NrdR